MAGASILGLLAVLVSVAAAAPPSSPAITMSSPAMTIPALAPSTSVTPVRVDSTSPEVLPVDVPATLADRSPEELVAMRAESEDAETAVMGSAPLSMGGLGREPGPISVEPDRESCLSSARRAPLREDGAWDPNLIAQMTHEVFGCLTEVAGLDEVSPTALRRWNGAERWGFGSLADQVAAEAVVVAYCESVGFRPSALTGANAFGYGGLFQMGSSEMRRFGESGSSRFDPADNAVAAANYFVYQYRSRAGWGGWSPWAVVNTNFDDPVNNQVRVPVLPRFVSSDPGFKGRPGADLPAWAVDPWSWEVPTWSGTGCPFTGRRWPAATPLES